MSSGAGGVPESSGPKPTEKVGSESPEKLETSVAGMKFRTLGDIKHALVSKLGKEQGTKLYNKFMYSVFMMMMAPTRQAAEHAKEAAKKMREKQ